MAIKIQGDTVINDSKSIVNVLDATFTGTTSVKLPAGTTEERPAQPNPGEIRYNKSTDSYEGYYFTNEWREISSGVSRYGMLEHVALIEKNYNITFGNNAISAGPVSIAEDISVTVPDGSVWTIV